MLTKPGAQAITSRAAMPARAVVCALAALCALAPAPLGCGRSGLHSTVSRGSCETRWDCPESERCIDGRCQAFCETASDCLASERCEHGLCVRVDAGAALDSGPAPDRAPADTSVAMDRAPADAGSDGAAPDVAAPDQAMPDAAAPDQAMADGGAADSGGGDRAVYCYDEPGRCSALELTARIGRRDAPGPFGAGLLLLPAAAPVASSHGDAVVLAPGAELGPGCYAHLDLNQGSAVLWYTPAYVLSELADQSSQPRALFALGPLRLQIDPAQRGLAIAWDDRLETFPDAIADWGAGVPHLLVLRWDTYHAIGSGHAALTVDGQLLQGLATPPAMPAPPVERIVIGAADVQGTAVADGLIEGFTVYRRPLFGTVGGVHVGHGDELGAIYAAGAGADPCLVTGSWDVVLALPGDGLLANLPADNQAWSHPHGANAMGVEGFLLGEVGAGFEQVGGTVAPSALDDTVYGGGVWVQTTGAGQGLQRTAFFTPGAAFVARALVHADGTSVPTLCVLNAGTGQEIATTAGRSSTHRTDIEQLVATGFNPASSNRLTVRVLNATTIQSGFALHQVELLVNLLANPSLEQGSGDPYIPDAWTNDQDYLASGQTWRELTTVHGGAASFGIDVPASATGLRNVWQAPAGDMLEWRFYTAGGFFYWLHDLPGQIFAGNSRFVFQHDVWTKFVVEAPAEAGVWLHAAGVGRRNSAALDSHNDILHWGNRNWGAAVATLIDDAYLLLLDAVEIDAVAASAAASIDDEWVAIDGADLATQAAVGIGETAGAVQVRLQIPYPAAARPLRCPYDGVLVAIDIPGNTGDFITLHYAASGPRVVAMFGGSLVDYTALEDPLADRQPHLLRLAYQSSSELGLDVDGRRLITQQLGAEHRFSAPLERLTFGGDPNGEERRCDVLIDRMGASFGP